MFYYIMNKLITLRCCFCLFQLYNEAMDLCMQMYGEYHILMTRLYINIGIVYEDNCDFKKAYEYFKKWARISEEILGPDHPKTKRARGVLRESRYQNIARNLDEWERTGHDSSPGDENVDETENQDLGNFYDDSSDQNDVNLIVSDCNQNVLSVGSLPNNEQENISNSEEEVSNGYFDGASSQDENSRSSNDESENSDHENLYDDCLDEYTEQYGMLNPMDDNLMNALNINIDDNDDIDDEIVQITSRENYENEMETDNRYAIYGGDNSDNESDNCSNNRHRTNQA